MFISSSLLILLLFAERIMGGEIDKKSELITFENTNDSMKSLVDEPATGDADKGESTEPEAGKTRKPRDPREPKEKSDGKKKGPERKNESKGKSTKKSEESNRHGDTTVTVGRIQSKEEFCKDINTMGNIKIVSENEFISFKPKESAKGKSSGTGKNESKETRNSEKSNTPSESKPSDKKPSDRKPSDRKPDEGKPSDKKSDENAPAETEKPVETDKTPTEGETGASNLISFDENIKLLEFPKDDKIISSFVAESKNEEISNLN
jgi:hypothetical protein